MFGAWRGEGATLNGMPIEASKVQSIGDAVLCACAPHNAAAMRPAVRSIEAVMPLARSVRILGSGVLNFAWVACGRCIQSIHACYCSGFSRGHAVRLGRLAMHFNAPIDMHDSMAGLMHTGSQSWLRGILQLVHS